MTIRECPVCGRSIPSEYRFCGHCGARLEAALLGADSTNEQREVTVMFVDVTNFTAASQVMDSEQVFSWMDETMRLLADVVDRYEGTIDKFTGDGLMALFGVPTAHENDPERAVRAALEMHDTLAPLRARVTDERGVSFQVRIGLNSGSVVAGTIGGERHGEYTVLGDAVNLASRLEKAAEPGTVLVSATTYERTRPLFAYQARPPLSVKGVSEPLQTYRPLGLAAQPGSLRGIAGLHAPLISRAADLASLHGCLAAVCADSRRRVALISGAAGLGKSRLVSELRQASADLPLRCIQAACLSHTRHTPLWLAGELLRGLLMISRADPPPERAARMAAFIRHHRLVAAELLPYLRHAMGDADLDPEAAARLATLDPSMLQRQTQAAIRQALLAAAREQPLALICDDLHWADQPSRDLLRYLLETTDEAALGFVLASRDPELGLVQDLVPGPPGWLVEIRLTQLSEEDGRRLIDELLHQAADDDGGLIELILQRAVGNPFYIEELIRVLIERGGLTLGPAGWSAAAHARALLSSVPTSLRELILARFDQLPSDGRATLQRLAAIGRAAPLRLLTRLDGGDPALSAARIAELEQRGFVIDQPVGAEPGWAIQHALVQDAIYETMLRRNRQQLHTLIAEAVVAEGCWGPEERTEVLARQYADSVTPQLAIPYLVEAAERAERRFAGEMAAQLYRRAIELMEIYPASQGPRAVRARSGLGRTLKALGSFADAGEALQEAQERLLVGGLPRTLWRTSSVELLGELADVRMREGQLDAAAGHIEAALALLEAQEQTAAWRLLLYRLASIRLRQGQIDQARQLAETAVRHVGPGDDQITLASLYRILGGVCYQQERLAEAADYVERSLILYREVGYAPGSAAAYDNLGSLYYTQGQWDRALASFEQARQLRSAIGYVPDQALNLANLGQLRLAMGDHAQAARDLALSRAISLRVGEELGVVRAGLGLIHLALIRRQLGEAQSYLDDVAGRMEAVGEDEAIQLLLLQALFHARSGALAEGRRLVTAGLEQAHAGGLAEQESEGLRILSEIYVQQGDQTAAEESLHASIALCRQRGDNYQLGLGLIGLGEIYQQRGEAQAASSVLQEAADRLAILGAAYDLARAHAAMGDG